MHGQRDNDRSFPAQFLYARFWEENSSAADEKKNSAAPPASSASISVSNWKPVVGNLRLRTQRRCASSLGKPRVGANSGSDFFRAVKKHLQCASTRKKRTLAFGFNRPSNAKTRHYTQHAPPAGRASRVRGFSEGTSSRPRARTRRSPLDRAARRAFPPGIEHTRGFSNHTWKR